MYKYMSKKYVENFFKKGSLKIGTLYEYRDAENLGGVVGDSEEGFHYTEVSFVGEKIVDLHGNSPEAVYLRKSLGIADGSHKNSVKMIIPAGTKILNSSYAENCYIYCVSAEFDPAVMAAFGCDACIEIINPDAFFLAISKKIRHKGNFETLREIDYSDRRTHFSRPHKTYPALMKGVDYAYQKELRAIWTAKRATVKPIFVDVPQAIKHCRAVIL